MAEYKRKLASIQLIEEIRPHDNSDNLELAIVLGWQVVIKKNEFKKGDKIIYFEIDSICPDRPWSEFLKSRGFRIRTIKLRNKISQGLILPINIDANINLNEQKIGDDVTDLIGVTKYESPEDKQCNIQGNLRVSTFPTHFGFMKTDEPRLQSHLKYLDLFKGRAWYATNKYDGTSGTFFIDPQTKELAVCSRNQRIEKPVDIKESKNNYWLVAEKYQLETLLSKIDHLVIQAEVYGPGIQGNKLNVKELMLGIFSIYDLNKKTYCLYREIVDYCQQMGLNMVRVDSEGDNFNFTLDELLEKARGKYSNSKYDREGLVFRLKDSNEIEGERASFKVINNDFLVNEK